MLRARRVSYLALPSELTILALRLLTVPLILAVLVAGQVVRLSGTGGMIAIVAVALAAIATFSPLAQRWDRALVLRIRRSLFLSLLALHERLGSPVLRKLVGRLVRVPFSSTRLPHDDQERVIEQILSTLESTLSPHQVFFVQGKSGTGKTTLVALLVHALIRRRALGSHSDSVFYFDFAASVDNQRAFLQQYPTLAFEDALVVVDNFHRIETRFLRDFTRFVLRCHHGCVERCLLILAQPLELVAPDTNIALHTATKRGGRFLTLDSPPQLDYPLPSVKSNGHTAAVLGLQQRRVERHASRSKLAEDALCLTALPERHDLIDTLALACALSIHRGVFTQAELRGLTRRTSGNWVRATQRYIRVSRMLGELVRVEFLSQTLLDSHTYLFHDALAKHYKDELSARDDFRTAFRACACVLHEAAREKNAVLAWLYAVEGEQTDEANRLYEHALLSGSFQTMLSALERNSHQPALVGQLLEKVGRFDEARTALRSLQDTAQPTQEHQHATIDLVESEHGPESRAQLTRIAKTPTSRLLELTARYWLIHLSMHDGRFEWDPLRRIVDAVAEHTSTAQTRPYRTLHLARRVYYDLLRLYYLRGTGDHEEWDWVIAHPLGQSLRSEHVQDSAFRHKFLDAHLAHYEHLFSIGVLAEEPATGLTSHRDGATVDTQHLITIARESYSRAVEEFEIFGDKTAEYILGRQLELAMAADQPDLGAVATGLHRYERFVRNAGFLDMVGYVEAYRAKLHVRRAFENMLRTGGDEQVRVDLLRASRELLSAERRHRTCANEYGRQRCTLLALLVNHLLGEMSAVDMPTALQHCRADAIRSGYHREVRMITHLLDSGGISPADVLGIARFYPVVHQ